MHKAKRGVAPFSILSAFPDSPDVVTQTPHSRKINGFFNGTASPPSHLYGTPRSLHSQLSNVSSNSTEEYKTPDGTLDGHWFEVQKSFSCDTVGLIKPQLVTMEYQGSGAGENRENAREGVLRSKSDYQIPRYSPVPHTFEKFVQKSDNLFSLLTPVAKRKNQDCHSTPNNNNNNNRSVSSYTFKIPTSPISKQGPLLSMQTRTTSLTSLKHGNHGTMDFANQRLSQR